MFRQLGVYISDDACDISFMIIQSGNGKRTQRNSCSTGPQHATYI